MKRWREVSAVVVLLLSLLAAFRVSAEDGAVTRDYISATEHLAASSAADRESNSEIAIVVVDENGNRREIPFSDPHVEDTRNLSWAEFEMLYPPDRGAEKIIHPIPDRPVIIDGVRYAPKEIRRFDGQVLRFIDDDRALREGVLYAFTTREGAEDYMRTEWGWSEESSSNLAAERMAPSAVFSAYWKDAFYSGSKLQVLPGAALSDLSFANFDNIISSLQIGPDTSTSIMYDWYNYAGDQLIKQRNESSSILVFMNDRISSIRTFN